MVAPSGWFCPSVAQRGDVLLDAVVAAAGVEEKVAVDAAGVGEQVPRRDGAGDLGVGDLEARAGR